MYAVPKEKYDAFLAGACKGDIKYTRQINQLDVNDGGKVIIRNDDHIKRTAAPTNQQKMSPSKATHSSRQTDESSIRFPKTNELPPNLSMKGNREGNDSSKNSDDFWDNFNERLRILREGLPSLKDLNMQASSEFRPENNSPPSDMEQNLDRTIPSDNSQTPPINSQPMPSVKPSSNSDMGE